MSVPSPMRVFKSLRNRLQDRRYRATPSPDREDFLHQVANRSPRVLCYAVAFNKPWLIHSLTACWDRFVTGADLAIVDNSNDPAAAQAIAALCRQRDVPYLKLPPLRERNPNRSHAKALNWVYDQLTSALKPDFFGLIDHDLIPIRPIDYTRRLDDLDFYGRCNASMPNGCWNLWAGYSFFRTDQLLGRRIDFHPQHHLGLDTGGGNWHSLYARADLGRVKFVDYMNHQMTLPDFTSEQGIMDDVFLHVGGAGYNTKTTAAQYVQRMERYLDDVLAGRDEAHFTPRPELNRVCHRPAEG